MVRLSIIVPVYNEENTIGEILDRVLSISYGCDYEVIVVDDGSTDASVEIAKQRTVGILRNHRNFGKGYSVRRGIKKATGEVIVVQDADLEYNPQDIPKIIAPIFDNRADIVFGNRFYRGGERYVVSFCHRLGNWLLTFMSNLFSNLNLSDEACGYRAFRRGVVDGISFKQNGFGFDPEFVAKIAQKQWRICEMPVVYKPRTIKQGKKIRIWHGLQALWVMMKYNIIAKYYG